jgi:mono/diheme cytochrome c family protein
MKEGKAFFFEKKKQKTFVRSVRDSMDKSFLVLFFKKELFLFLLLPSAALADAASVSTSTVHATTGAQVYQHVCQGCHMPGGVGAVGAGRFPALAGNAHLAAARYPVAMVLRGNGGMPWFNGTLDDAQIAAVVNYVRSNFGNHYTDTVTPADVASMHGPAPVTER